MGSLSFLVSFLPTPQAWLQAALPRTGVRPGPWCPHPEAHHGVGGSTWGAGGGGVPQKQRLNRAREIWGENTRLLSPHFTPVLVGNTIWAPEKSMDQPSGGTEVRKQGMRLPRPPNAHLLPACCPGSGKEKCECLCVECQVEKD